MPTRYTDLGSWFGWPELGRMASVLDEFRREMGEDLWTPRVRYAGEGWLRAELRDTGSTVVLTADVPGLATEQVRVSLHGDVLTLSGERAVKVPEGHSVHRQERPSMRFSRSFKLPTRVDAEKTTAVAKDGVLTVTMPKSPDTQPRQIAIKAG